MSKHGKFVWHDLMTTDVEKAKGFYGELFGWKVKAESMGAMPYHLILIGERDIGGMMALDPKQGIPSHWYGYVTVDKIEPAVERLKAKGGQTMMPITDIPKIGRFAVASDPHGGVFAPFEYAAEMAAKPEPEGPPPVGHFCWDELLTPDADAAKAFYTHTFGWGVESVDMGPMGTYTLWKRGDQHAGGMMKAPDMPRPAWVTYVGVASADTTAARTKSLGGSVRVEPTDVPNVGRFAILVDPTGATFGILQAAKPQG
jgi:uncharacterized protein